MTTYIYTKKIRTKVGEKFVMVDQAIITYVPTEVVKENVEQDELGFWLRLPDGTRAWLGSVAE